jgi:hypothetical protein
VVRNSASSGSLSLECVPIADVNDYGAYDVIGKRFAYKMRNSDSGRKKALIRSGLVASYAELGEFTIAKSSIPVYVEVLWYEEV